MKGKRAGRSKANEIKAGQVALRAFETLLIKDLYIAADMSEFDNVADYVEDLLRRFEIRKRS